MTVLLNGGTDSASPRVLELLRGQPNGSSVSRLIMGA